jgi:Uma2 family endonuclease
MTQPVRQLFSFADYVLLEEMSTVKHEFAGGQVWAMAGGTPEHAAIAGNVIGYLREALRGKPSRVFTSDLRMRVVATGLGTYPDVSVICGEVDLDPEDQKRHTATNPTLLVEVLSPSTEEYDCGEKLENYKQIASLQSLLLIASEKREVTLWRRGPNGWESECVRDRGSVSLASLGCELPLDEIYFDPLKGGA